ncbi:MAG: phosphoribosyl-ATP diphosphatase [Hyphomicrobiales bacterium]|nr:phosphoribosyl-ATP diphosphatase [Hyphomicrobiales bacterium]
MTTFGLSDLDSIISERSAADASTSYTKSLLDSGVERAAKKFGEEAFEMVIAAIQGDKAALAAEAADVLFHFLVLLRASEVPLVDVMAVLGGRTAQSGLAEKAARKS